MDIAKIERDFKCPKCNKHFEFGLFHILDAGIQLITKDESLLFQNNNVALQFVSFSIELQRCRIEHQKIIVCR